MLSRPFTSNFCQILAPNLGKMLSHYSFWKSPPILDRNWRRSLPVMQPQPKPWAEVRDCQYLAMLPDEVLDEIWHIKDRMEFRTQVERVAYVKRCTLTMQVPDETVFKLRVIILAD